ncbi:ATP-binding cassette domain-containing protein [Pedobacter nutrimenti]|jgi:ABC-type branched-subunit amino acid transport system ATPase component|uniref:ABC-type branched-subunit amino acid transport system ATPase component n=1 Tax=Pedobacter nutrimenti TaxID=1241337 RepID=A0A318UL92_9SPHI|nr:ATP-binding cassette domain-containing protein [Pedobacter nutrimenti]PYF77216.1 ABC-type branched-subunit amino acid transport system ATPase component [Pedobacter nutrimenti]
MIHVLEADGIQLEFGSRPILSDVYIKCTTGKITGLLGRNGEGKTSLLHIIYGHLNASYKCIRFDGTFVQSPFKNPELLRYLPQFNFIPGNFSLKRVFSDFDMDFSLFEQRFPEFKSKYNSRIKTLSGGQRRLTEIYMILKSPGHFAILDEPFSQLSPILIESIKELIQSEKAHKGLIITDHMFRHILEISDDLYVLSNGKTHKTNSEQDLERLGYVRSL